ncbi:MAG: site-specific integrase [Ktedonobacteraceae bacterium]|nr:site-specific integrase [Ktedonobacteraceae bacterium]
MAKSRRRARGEGSVFQRKNGRWVVQVYIEDGKRKQFYVGSEREGIQKLRQVQREIEEGTLATGKQQKLGDYLIDWIENVHRDNLRISTYVKYKKLVKYVVADLGHIWLKKLTPQQVRRFYTKLGERLSSKTVHEVHGVLRLALANAVRWNLVSRNVCELVKPPRVVKRDVKPLTLHQARALLEQARGHRLEVLLTVAVVTGMRRGELLALRWSSIDFERHYLIVEHTVDFIARYGYVENEPKTAAGKRLIHLPLFLVDMLKQHRIEQLGRRSQCGDAWKDHDLVFANLHGGYFSPRYLGDLFNGLLKKAGLVPMHFHDLRHSAATILMGMGVNAKAVQELLGHSDISITLGIYGHVLPSMQQDIVDIWDGEFGGESENNDRNEEGDGK